MAHTHLSRWFPFPVFCFRRQPYDSHRSTVKYHQRTSHICFFLPLLSGFVRQETPAAATTGIIHGHHCTSLKHHRCTSGSLETASPDDSRPPPSLSFFLCFCRAALQTPPVTSSYNTGSQQLHRRHSRPAVSVLFLVETRQLHRRTASQPADNSGSSAANHRLSRLSFLWPSTTITAAPPAPSK